MNFIMFLEFQVFTRIWKNGTVAKDIAKRLNISTATLYEYVNGDGSPKEPAVKLLSSVAS